jgi:hypothetical protein
MCYPLHTFIESLDRNTITDHVKSSNMPKKLQDYVPRGRTESTPLGTTIFCGLRALDPLLQRSLLLSASLVPYFGRSAANPPPAGGDVITTAGLGLTPFQAVIWGMSVGSAVKQIFWLSTISNEVSEMMEMFLAYTFDANKNLPDIKHGDSFYILLAYVP